LVLALRRYGLGRLVLIRLYLISFIVIPIKAA
jgi:hypothetical protein